MKKARRIQQYLDRYTLPDSHAAADLVGRRQSTPFRRVLCVPMFDESSDFIAALSRHPDIGNTLVIAVINAPDSAHSDALGRTRALFGELNSPDARIDESDHAVRLRLTAAGSSFELLLMDHCTTGRTLPDDEGVGLARKLANDVALFLWHRGQIASPWLFQTDADATLPDNYFDTPRHFDDCAAVHLNFEHTHPAEISLAQRLYDLKLDYYVAGLAHAGSPFAHYSVGSSLVINADYYAIVRGYSRHSAGEDFYVLNKLAKVGRIGFDRSRTVRLAERDSMRVPFGTGPGVARFNATPSPATAAMFYAPACFTALRDWLVFLDDCAESLLDDSFNAAARFAQHLDESEAATATCAAVDKLGLFDWLAATLRRNRRPEQRRHQLTTGMDALRTLRLVHALRDHGLHNVDAGTAAAWLDAHPAAQVRLRGDGYRDLILA